MVDQGRVLPAGAAGWRAPSRWAAVGRWLLVPFAVLAWFTVVPETATVVVFALAVVGLLGIAAATVVRMVPRGRVTAGVVGAVLLVGGIVLLGVNPVPGQVDGLGDWWPSVLTQPQIVGGAYWVMVSLGVVLTGGALLATLLVTALLGGPRSRVR